MITILIICYIDEIIFVGDVITTVNDISLSGLGTQKQQF